jgi:dolichyl-phosphate beta-glucosyltransferase
MSLSLSIVIPAFNEAARLGETLHTVFEYLNKHIPKAEVIVVDDGSSDRTADVAEESFARAGAIGTEVIRVRPNRGKGYVVRTGLLAARAPIALFSDADLSTPITEAPKLVNPIERGEFDLTFGSRALDRNLIGVHQPWRREQGGRIINLIVRLATGLPFWDTQCGFKAFRMDVCRPIIEAATIERFGFDVEYLYVAYLAELRLKEIAVRWDHNEGSKLSVMRDTPRLLEEVRTVRKQVKRGVYTHAIAAARVGAKDVERALHNSAQPISEADSTRKLASAFKADAGD